MPGKRVLLATEKAFAASAVKSIEEVIAGADGYTLAKLEGYTNVEDLKQAVAQADACIVRSDKMTAEIMDSGKDSLKLIVRAGAGVDTIDLQAATDRSRAVYSGVSWLRRKMIGIVGAFLELSAQVHFWNHSVLFASVPVWAVVGEMCLDLRWMMMKMIPFPHLGKFAADSVIGVPETGREHAGVTSLVRSCRAKTTAGARKQLGRWSGQEVCLGADAPRRSLAPTVFSIKPGI